MVADEKDVQYLRDLAKRLASVDCENLAGVFQKLADSMAAIVLEDEPNEYMAGKYLREAAEFCRSAAADCLPGPR